MSKGHGGLSKKLIGRLLKQSGKPLRISAVPRDHVEGDREAGELLLKGVLTHRGETMKLANLDFADHSIERPIVRYLHSFAWLRDVAAATGREQGAKLGEAVARRWLARHGEKPDAAWAPALLGERLLFLIAYAPFVLSTNDPDYRRVLLNVMARGARTLDAEADKATPGLERITAWAGLTVASLTLSGNVPRIAKGEAGLTRALAQGQHDDGGLMARRPWEQALLVDRLGLTRAAYFAAKQSLPDAVEEATTAALAALHGVRHGDGGLSGWQGGNPGDPVHLNALVEGCGVRARPLREPRGWGYHRLSALGTVVQIDAAPPPTGPYADASHAGTLGIELSDCDQRIVMSCGGDGPSGRLPTSLAQALRATAAHSTLVLEDADSSIIDTAGKLKTDIRDIDVARREKDGASQIEAGHEGYAKRFGLSHRRTVKLSDTGKQVDGMDVLEPVGRRLRRPERAFALRFHLAPGIEVTPTADGLGALLRCPAAPPWQFRCDGATLGIEESLVVNGVGRPLKTQQLVIAGAAGKEGAHVHWHFRRSS